MKTLIILAIFAFVSCDASNSTRPVAIEAPMQTIQDTVEFIGCYRAQNGMDLICTGYPQKCPVNRMTDIIGHLVYCNGEWRYLRRP